MKNNIYTVDSLDKKIVNELTINGRMSAGKIAKKLHKVPATIRRRINRLMKNDILRIVGVVNPTKFGYSIRAVLTLNVTHNKLETTIKELHARPEIQWMATSTGRHNIIAGTLLPSLDALSYFIAKVLPSFKGIKDVETFVCLDQVKESFIHISTPLV